jgi:hypothetical protein
MIVDKVVGVFCVYVDNIGSNRRFMVDGFLVIVLNFMSEKIARKEV